MIDKIYKILKENNLDAVSFNIEGGFQEQIAIVISKKNQKRCFRSINTSDIDRLDHKKFIEDLMEEMVIEINSEGEA